MLENYTKLSNGVIKQVNIKQAVSYNFDYSNKYNSYGEKGKQLAFMRLGTLLATIQKTPNSILDIGYGNGDFLFASSQMIPNCYGFDLSSYPVPDKCVKEDKINYDKHYDVITFFDSLEHFDSIDFIKDLDCDYIMITLPWCHYFSDEWFKNWHHRREDEHIWHFDKNALINFFDEMGFDNILISNFEDAIRKQPVEYENILAGIFKKRSN